MAELIHAVAAAARQAAAVPPPRGRAVPTLSQRERDCLKLSAAGLNTDAIAFRQAISERTVRFHIGNAMTKLAAASRAHAIARALQLNLLG